VAPQDGPAHLVEDPDEKDAGDGQKDEVQTAQEVILKRGPRF